MNDPVIIGVVAFTMTCCGILLGMLAAKLLIRGPVVNHWRNR